MKRKLSDKVYNDSPFVIHLVEINSYLCFWNFQKKIQDRQLILQKLHEELVVSFNDIQIFMINGVCVIYTDFILKCTCNLLISGGVFVYFIFICVCFQKRVNERETVHQTRETVHKELMVSVYGLLYISLHNN